jgi:predicted transcriptional regulator
VICSTLANEGDPDESPTGLKMSRKRYYTKLSKLIKTGLIKRKNGIYVLTLFGKAIYEVQLGFGTAVDNNLKSKVEKTEIIN